MAREDLHFRLRIPETLKKQVETAAVENHRSMTAEIVARLEDSFKTRISEYDAEEVMNAIRDVVTSKHLSDAVPPNVHDAFLDFMIDVGIENQDIALTHIIVEYLEGRGYLKDDEVPDA